VEGWLTGGNITLLASLVGTGYLPSWQGAIVVFEDVGEAPYRLDRELLQLYQSGAFDGVEGVVLGQFTDCTGKDAEDLAEDRVIRFLRSYLQIPIIYSVAVGHGDDSRSVTFGLSGRLDPVKSTLEVSLGT